MCNQKGWDIAFYSDHVGIEPHNCREYGDCGSEDRTLEEAAEDCAKWHDEQAALFRSGKHPDLIYYRSFD